MRSLIKYTIFLLSILFFALSALAGSYALQTNGDVLYPFKAPAVQSVTHKAQYTTDLTGTWQDYLGAETQNGSMISVTIPQQLRERKQTLHPPLAGRIAGKKHFLSTEAGLFIPPIFKHATCEKNRQRVVER